MYQDFYEYIRKLHLFVESQEQRIRQLEYSLNEMQKEIQELKAKPPISVGRIEYKFDQLKVETLEGTLNIGLNPSDMQGIEDFAVGNQTLSTPFSPAEQMRQTIDVEDEILNYVDSDSENIISACEKEFSKTVDSSYYSFIKEDIKKQLPGRIEHYLNQIPMQKRQPEYEVENKDKIIQQLKIDIEKGITAFVRNLPDTRKG
ncbi:spore germination protein GerPC [Neobacillus terrae]|uniref:spore germination protein GerPC n=1 Tax=Neobacillus terrae TaxID=3034837 RepID=UPI00140C2F26|nr:spore germination protein GerPC [Neobacillus terrae]NHM31708.1 spore gernimation protein [Neobacillus terrae]